MDFYQKVLIKIFIAVNHNYKNNYDYEIRKLSIKRRFKKYLESIITKIVSVFFNSELILISNKNYYYKNIEKYQFLYELLSDDESKEKYIELLIFKILGNMKVKLSLNNKSFWDTRKDVNNLKKNNQILKITKNKELFRYDLSNLGLNAELFYHNNGIVTTFMLEQYSYTSMVTVVKDDIVIDCGGCWGDTALFFSDKGAKKVYVYEFVESNIEIMKKNLDLNEKLKKKIKIIEKAVWSESGMIVEYNDKGPSSRVKQGVKKPRTVKTLTIDDLVKNENIEHVNFIKMDIESAEMEALKGAEKTIRKFKPKLAISVYHKADDFIVIPRYINELNKNYKFYLDYYTIFGEEIILYAI